MIMNSIVVAFILAVVAEIITINPDVVEGDGFVEICVQLSSRPRGTIVAVAVFTEALTASGIILKFYNNQYNIMIECQRSDSSLLVDRFVKLPLMYGQINSDQMQ